MKSKTDVICQTDCHMRQIDMWEKMQIIGKIRTQGDSHESGNREIHWNVSCKYKFMQME